MGCPVPGAQPLCGAPLLRRLAYLVHRFGGEHVGLHLVDLVPAGGAMEAQEQFVLGAGPERVLHLVAVAPLLDCGHDRLDGRGLEAPEPLQGIGHLLLLDLELALIGQHLPGRAGVRSLRLDPVRPRLDDLGEPCLCKRLLALLDRGPHAVARNRTTHEDDVTLEPADAGAPVRQGVDRELYLLPALRPSAATGGRGRRGSVTGHRRISPAFLRSRSGPTCGSRCASRNRAPCAAPQRRDHRGARRPAPR